MAAPLIAIALAGWASAAPVQVDMGWHAAEGHKDLQMGPHVRALRTLVPSRWVSIDAGGALGWAMTPVFGDINGGVMDLRQLFSRPVGWRQPYTTPDPELFLCSASTPPGGGVHGMCGVFAARAALRRLRQAR